MEIESLSKSAINNALGLRYDSGKSIKGSNDGKDGISFSSRLEGAIERQDKANSLKGAKPRHEVDKGEDAKLEDAKLMEVCYEFESLLVNRMFKSMYNSIDKSNLLNYGGHAEEVFNDMLYNERALEISKTGEIGLAKIIYEQLKEGQSR